MYERKEGLCQTTYKSDKVGTECPTNLLPKER